MSNEQEEKKTSMMSSLANYAKLNTQLQNETGGEQQKPLFRMNVREKKNHCFVVNSLYCF